MAVTGRSGPAAAPRTPPGAEDTGRNRYVDFLRVLAIALVVFGHWLTISLSYSGGRLRATDAMEVIGWAPWVTLLLQVMPVFFLVGGYAAAASFARHLDSGQDAYDWLRQRTVRLVVPTTVYVATVTVLVGLSVAAGVPSNTLALDGWGVALHLWFLPVYLLLLLLTPTLYAAHRRWGLAVAGVMAAGAVLVDTAVLALHATWLGWLNYALVWGAVYQAGFSWQDRTLLRGRRPLLLAAGGIAALSLLIRLGPFPVSMLGIARDRVKNTTPPSAALLAYATAQTGLLLLAAGAGDRRLARPRPARAVARANRMVMTVYLWHMIPVVIVGVTLYQSGLVTEPAIGTAPWWALRVVWIAALSLVLPPFITLVAALHRPLRHQGPAAPGGPGTAPRRATAVLCTGAVLTGFALYKLAIAGFAPNGRPPAATLTVYALGTVLVLIPPRRLSPRAESQLPDGHASGAAPAG